MGWRMGLNECMEHKLKSDDKLCRRCTLKDMCSCWAEQEKKRKKKEKVRFTWKVVA
jgi:hypothetical protein